MLDTIESRACLDAGKGEVAGCRSCALPPLVKKPSVACRQSFVPGNVESRCHGIDPLGQALQFGVTADGRFVDHAMAMAVGPLGAPLFIEEYRFESKRGKDAHQSLRVGDFCFAFDAVLMSIFSDAGVGDSLVGQDGPSGVFADANQLTTGAQRAVWSVEELVTLKAAGRNQAKPENLKLSLERGWIVYREFDLSFESHHSC